MHGVVCTLGILLLLTWGTAGAIASLWLLSLVVAHHFGWVATRVGMEVGHWSVDHLISGIYWHFSWSHLWTNIDAMLLASAILADGSVIWWEIPLLIAGSASGFILGVQAWGEPHSIHAGASGIVQGFMLAACGSLFGPRARPVTLSTCLCGAWITFLTLRQYLPGIPMQTTSWEGHLGGLLGGGVAFAVIFRGRYIRYAMTTSRANTSSYLIHIMEL
jgi:membrane associated rhomboid family serine protease